MGPLAGGYMRPKATGLCFGIACVLVSGIAVAQPTEPTPTPTPTPAPVADPAPAPVVDPAPATTPSSAPTHETPPTTSSSASLGTAFGVGVHAFLTGPYGPALVYNM